MSNEWISIEEIIEVTSSKDWTWMKNSRCKYLNIRMDTRDGHCLISDRNNERISLDQLRYQIGVKSSPPDTGEK